MHDVVLVEDLEGVDELLEDEQRLLFGDDAVLAEDALEGAAVAVLVDEVEVVGGLEHVDVLDDVLVLLDVGEDVDLVDGALLQLLVLLEAPHLDHLHRVLLVVVLVYRPEHLPVRPLPDYLVQRVVFDYPHHNNNDLNLRIITTTKMNRSRRSPGLDDLAADPQLFRHFVDRLQAFLELGHQLALFG